ncbi:MAG: hypothetical protein K0S74_1682 [Chlamydiales bacterium]|jgi:hypothetical protein|nr:hypothetical protein [Chlamydiales bacterium]
MTRNYQDISEIEDDFDMEDQSWGEDFEPDLPLIDELVKVILMHRNSHFGGLFTIMLDYYDREEKGCSEEFSFDEVAAIAQWEKEAGQDLAPMLLSEAELNRVQKAQEMYQQLRAIYEVKQEKNIHPRLIADLVLADNEEDEEQAIEAVVKAGTSIIPALIDILKTDEMYDPLFPGYGLAPALAAMCLGKLKDPQVVSILFELSDSENEYIVDAARDALIEVQEIAKPFLLQILQSRPYTRDNQKALNILLSFKDPQEIAPICLKLLEDSQIYSHSLLVQLLVLGCEFLTQPTDRQKLLLLSELSNFPKEAKEELRFIAKAWK